MIDESFFPYGQSNFESIRRDKQFFVDNTAYIREFEKFRFQCFTRPPRWGKSLLTQIMSFYYDNATTPEEWDTLFGGAHELAIHKNPTELRGHFQVLELDFSTASDAGSVEKMNALLTKHINDKCVAFGGKYGYNISTDMIETDPELIYYDETDAMFTLTRLGRAVHARGEKLYLIVDEYDRYANVCLLDREDVDSDGYKKAVIDTDGPIKRFFSTLKSLESCGYISRLFVTGLLRLAISDAYASNGVQLTSADRAVGAALGYTSKEVERAVSMLELGATVEERQRFEEQALDLIKTYFNGYRFPGVDDDGLYCPQLCNKVFIRLCDEKNWVYLDDKDPDCFWKKLAPKVIMRMLGDEASDPSGAGVRLLARLPEATKELRLLSEGPVEFDSSILQSRGKLSGLLAAGKAGRLGRMTTATGSVSERREAALSFMFDQGLVTRGLRKNTLVFPNAVAKVCVNQTILPQSKKVRLRKYRNRAAVFATTVATTFVATFREPIMKKLTLLLKSRGWL